MTDSEAGAVIVGRPSAARTWLLAARPATLPASAAPVIVGLGAAVGSGAAFRLDTALGCLVVAQLLQVAANFANDLSDFRRGADNERRMGPVRVAAAGLMTERQLQAGIAVLVAGAGLIGLYLAWVGGPAMIVLGLAAVIALLAYTGGPWPYGYKGLGEIFVFVFFGLMAAGLTAYLQSLRFDWAYLAAAVPPGAFAAAILITNNLRDIPTDRDCGKRTLAVIFGERFAKAEYLAMILLAAAAPVAMVVAGVARPSALVALAALVLARRLVREVLAVGPGTDRRRLNLVLKGTGRLSLAYGILFAIGLAVR